MSDVGLTIYEDPNDFYTNFPFMRDPNDKRYAYLYNNNTDWQDLIYKNSTSTDHLFRVEGGMLLPNTTFRWDIVATTG